MKNLLKRLNGLTTVVDVTIVEGLIIEPRVLNTLCDSGNIKQQRLGEEIREAIGQNNMLGNFYFISKEEMATILERLEGRNGYGSVANSEAVCAG